MLLGASITCGFLVALAVPAMARLVLAGDPGLSLTVGAAFLVAALLALHAAPDPRSRLASAWAAAAVAALASVVLYEVQVSTRWMHVVAWSQVALALAGAVAAKRRSEATTPPTGSRHARTARRRSCPHCVAA